MNMKFIIAVFLAGFALFLGSVGVAYAGKVELTTYYPAPNGEYQDLQATTSLKLPIKTVAAGSESTLVSGEIWVDPCAPTGQTWNGTTCV